MSICASGPTDAIGFYSHLAEIGVEPWDIFRPMWDVGTNAGALFDASGANRDDFLYSWASSVLRQADRSAAWDTTGPDIPAGVAYQPVTLSLGDGDKLDIGAPFFTNDIDYVSVGADMLHVRLEGWGRLNDGAYDTTGLDDTWFCISGHECKKKCESAPEPPPIAGTINSFVVLAVSGGKDGSVGTIEARDLEKDCETPTPSATADEFCSRYRDYVAWAKSNGSDDITKPLAGEIANRFIDMQPYAPAELAGHVALMIRVYSTYASAPPYIDLPMVGPDAAHIPEALTAMSNYCHVSFP